jgi:hypothetical protein
MSPILNRAGRAPYFPLAMFAASRKARGLIF